MIALTVALSLTVLIPVPATNGFVTLCEAGIYTTASLFGPLGGLTVGATSGLLIDLISGYPQWAIFVRWVVFVWMAFWHSFYPRKHDSKYCRNWLSDPIDFSDPTSAIK